jgi:hypothetical protein
MKIMFIKPFTFDIFGTRKSFRVGDVVEAEPVEDGGYFARECFISESVAERYCVILGSAYDIELAIEKLRTEADVLNKLANRLASTKACHVCGGSELIKLMSQNVKVCGECGHEMHWRLDNGQRPLL